MAVRIGTGDLATGNPDDASCLRFDRALRSIEGDARVPIRRSVERTGLGSSRAAEFEADGVPARRTRGGERSDGRY